MSPRRRQANTRHTTYTPEEARPMTPHERAVDAEAAAVAAAVIDHIDLHYPDMWHGVPKSARRSVRNTVYNQVTALLQRWALPDVGALDALAGEVWSMEAALTRLGHHLFQVRRETPAPCAFCGAMLPPRPAGEGLPMPGDDEGWAVEATHHRPGCTWVSGRALPGFPYRGPRGPQETPDA